MDNNFIVVEIDIKQDDINKDIQIWNSYEEYSRTNGEEADFKDNQKSKRN